MNPFQWLYNKIDSWTAPAWLKNLLAQIQEIIVNIALGIGKEALHSLETKVIEIASQDLTNEEKFRRVFNFARKELLISIKDSALRLLIEAIVNRCKASGIID